MPYFGVYVKEVVLFIIVLGLGLGIKKSMI